jgi:SAM-dependent methyltransferase
VDSHPRPPRFRADLYRGTATYYDQYRPPYPKELLDHLVDRAHVGGSDRLLDLACGTGQVTFGLLARFSEVWAVDQEDEAVAFARAKAKRLGVGNVRWLTGRAEDLDIDQPFALITVGNAFHRLDRHQVARSALQWLVPGGHLALLWSSTPWTGPRDWQRVLGTVVLHWTHVAGAADRVPPGLDAVLAAEPNLAVLAAAGFTDLGRFECPTMHRWTVDTLAGLLYSTSILSRIALGDHAEPFERDLRERLLSVNPDGVFEEEISFACELATRP